MLSKIKSWAIAGLAILATVAYALFRTEQARRAKEKLKGVQQARETERKAGEALVDGLKKEQEVRNEEVDTNRRDHFES